MHFKYHRLLTSLVLQKNAVTNVSVTSNNNNVTSHANTSTSKRGKNMAGILLQKHYTESATQTGKLMERCLLY